MYICFRLAYANKEKRKQIKVKMKMYLDEYFVHVDDIVLDVHNKVKDYYFHKLDLMLMLIQQEHSLNVDDHELRNLDSDMYIIENEYNSMMM